MRLFGFGIFISPAKAYFKIMLSRCSTSRKSSRLSRWLLLACLWAMPLRAATQESLDGLWIADLTQRWEGLGISLELHIESGKVSGNMYTPFQDMPILEGIVEGNGCDLVFSMDNYGQERRLPARVVKNGSILSVALPISWWQENIWSGFWWMGPRSGGNFGGVPPPANPPPAPNSLNQPSKTSSGGPPPGGTTSRRRYGFGPGGPPPNDGPGNPPPEGPSPSGPPPNGGGPPPAPAIPAVPRLRYGTDLVPMEYRRIEPSEATRDLTLRQAGSNERSARAALNYATLTKPALPELKTLPPNGLTPTPPMGWTTKQKYRTAFEASEVRQMVLLMATNGMRDAGYQYITLDDGWQGERDAQGVLQPNAHFPDMKGLADFVHSHGFKFGIYSTPAPRTYRGFIGSFGHEELDAQTWASWGVDYLKYEWCAASRVYGTNDMPRVFQKMAEALRATGRPIVYAICAYGRNEAWRWSASAGGNLCRSTIDIGYDWRGMGKAGFSQDPISSFGGAGHWIDPDMLVTGYGRMNEAECRAQLSLWSLLAAPLLTGNDLRRISPIIRNAMINPDVIAVDQDARGKPGRRLRRDGDEEIWTRSLANGDLAVGLFNRGEAPMEIKIRWADLGLAAPVRVRDLWARAEVPSQGGEFSAQVPAHGAALLRLSPSR